MENTNNHHQCSSSQISTPKSAHFDIGMSMMTVLLKKTSSLTPQPDEEQELIMEILKIADKKKARDGKPNFQDHPPITDEKCEEIHQIASFHAQAMTFNQNTTTPKNQIKKEDVCPCGCHRARGDSLPFFQDQTKQFFFGPGIILFFYYLRKILLLVLVSTVIYGIFALTTNIILSDKDYSVCASNAGTLSFLCEYKILSTTANKANNEALITVQLWLGFLFCCVWMIVVRMIQSLGRRLNMRIDRYLDSSSDYCIQIDNLPFGSYVEGEILKHLIKLWKKEGKGDSKDNPLIIKSVQIIYIMEEPRKYINEIVNCAVTMTEMLEKVDNKYTIKPQLYEQFMQLKEKIQEDCEKIELLRKKFIEDSSFRSQYATSTALVEFHDSDQQTDFIRDIGQYRTTIFGQIKDYLLDQCFSNEEGSNLFKGHQLRIIRAPQPSDIHWNNCQLPFSYKRVGLLWLLPFMIVGVSFGVLMLISFINTQFDDASRFSVLISISLQLFNRLIWNALVKMIGFEENNTKTDNIISIMSKSTVTQSINVIILPIITNLIIKDNLGGPQGLIGLSLDYQFTVLIMMLNLNMLNFPYQLTQFSLCIPCIRNYIIRSKSKPVGQIDTREEIKDVLAYYSPPEFPIAGAYVYITTVIYHAMFFCYAQPTLLFYLLFNICCFFLVQKYLLLKRCKIPELIDFLIFDTCISMMKHVPFFYGTGSLMFMILLEDNPHFGYYVPSCLCLVLWFLYMQNPKKIFNSLNKALLGLCGCEEERTQRPSEENNESHADFLKNLARSSFIHNKFSERRQCYYKDCNTRLLLNYESVLTEVKDNSLLDRNRQFCERFNVNMTKKKIQKVAKTVLNTEEIRPKKGQKKIFPLPINFGSKKPSAKEI